MTEPPAEPDDPMARAARHMLSECIRDACGEDVILPAWVAGHLRELVEAAERASSRETRTEWAVFWGVDNPNDADPGPIFRDQNSGLHIRIGEDHAMSWVLTPGNSPNGKVWRAARRDVLVGPWVEVPAPAEEHTDGINESMPEVPAEQAGDGSTIAEPEYVDIYEEHVRLLAQDKVTSVSVSPAALRKVLERYDRLRAQRAAALAMADALERADPVRTAAQPLPIVADRIRFALGEEN